MPPQVFEVEDARMEGDVLVVVLVPTRQGLTDNDNYLANLKYIDWDA